MFFTAPVSQVKSPASSLRSPCTWTCSSRTYRDWHADGRARAWPWTGSEYPLERLRIRARTWKECGGRMDARRAQITRADPPRLRPPAAPARRRPRRAGRDPFPCAHGGYRPGKLGHGVVGSGDEPHPRAKAHHGVGAREVQARDGRFPRPVHRGSHAHHEARLNLLRQERQPRHVNAEARSRDDVVGLDARPLGPSRWSRTPLPCGSADLSRWPVSTSTTPSTRSRSHHAPLGPESVSALLARIDRAAAGTRPGRRDGDTPSPRTGSSAAA